MKIELEGKFHYKEKLFSRTMEIDIDENAESPINNVMEDIEKFLIVAVVTLKKERGDYDNQVKGVKI